MFLSRSLSLQKFIFLINYGAFLGEKLLGETVVVLPKTEF